MNLLTDLSIYIVLSTGFVLGAIILILAIQLIAYQVFNFNIAYYLLNQINGKELYKIHKHSSKRKMVA